MNRRGIIFGMAALLVAGMAVLVVGKVRRDRAEAAQPVAAGQVEEPGISGTPGGMEKAGGRLPPGEVELPAEREFLEAGRPLTPELAEEKMEKAMAIPELNIRAKAAGLLIRDLCAAGYPEDAWRLVDPARGQVRELGLLAYFRYSRLKPQELLLKIKELPDKAEARRSLDGLLSGGTLEDLYGLLRQPGVVENIKEVEKGNPPEVKPLLVELVNDRMAANRSDLERNAVALFARKLYDLKAINGSELMAVSVKDAYRDIFERWEEVRALTAAEGMLYEGNPHRTAMLAVLMTNEPERALTVLAVNDDAQGRADLADAVRIWHGKVPESVVKWLEGHGQELSPAQRDAVHAALSKSTAAAGDKEAARRWAAKVEDAAIRKGLAGE